MSGHGIRRTFGLAMGLLGAGLAQPAWSDFADDFESYTLGDEVGSPWVVTDTSSTGQSLDITANQSPFTAGAQAVTFLDTVTTNSNPDLAFTLPTSWTGPLRIQFDYQVVANSGQNITFYLLGEDGDQDLHLRLRSGAGMRNKTDTEEELIRGISLGDWYHVDILTSSINPAGLETYDISVTRASDNSTTTVRGLPFRRDVDTAYASVLFQDVSGSTATSEWTVDNFSVTEEMPPVPWDGRFFDDFESYNLGDEVGSPWEVADTDLQDGPSPLGQSLNITTNQSRYTPGARAVNYVDNNTDRSNPDLLYTLPTAWAGPLNIQFDYRVDANTGNNITMFLRGVDGAADGYLRLRSGAGLRNQDDVNGTTLIRGVPLGLWMHVDITTSAINPSGLETWDITGTRRELDGSTSSATVTNLLIRKDVDTAYASILFQDGSGASNTSDWTLDNFRVTAITPPLGMEQAASSVTVTWDAAAGGVLRSTTDLTADQWSDVADGTATGGSHTVTSPLTNEFFSLRP